MRLFVALEIPSAVRERFADLLRTFRPLAPQARWVRAENLHVTLKFIGEVQEAELGAIQNALAAVRSDREVAIEFRGLGFFPNEKRSRVFWAGVEGSLNFEKLASDIETALEKLGILREQRPFSPHLTLAGFQPPGLPEKLRSAIGENAAPEFGSLQTNEFVLIESRLKSSGAEYTTRARFRFVAAED